MGRGVVPLTPTDTADVLSSNVSLDNPVASTAMVVAPFGMTMCTNKEGRRRERGRERRERGRGRERERERGREEEERLIWCECLRHQCD